MIMLVYSSKSVKNTDILQQKSGSLKLDGPILPKVC